MPPPELVFKVELIRSPIMGASVVLFALVTKYPKKRLALVSGLTLFWIGGMVALGSVAHILPPALIVAHTFEIMLQNFLTGMLVGYLFFTKSERAA